jgi:hypothetical protein
MVITRHDWRINGDLLAWLATSYPGLTAEQYEAGYRLLADPNLSDEAGAAVEVQELLAGCAAASATTLADTGRGRREGDEARQGAQAS